MIARMEYTREIMPVSVLQWRGKKGGMEVEVEVKEDGGGEEDGGEGEDGGEEGKEEEEGK